MTKHFYRDMDTMHNDILSLFGVVEEMIDNAATALRERDVHLAMQVSATDEEVDQREVHIEEFCLKMLALHQPVAIELRRVATVMKVNSDLERIADLAVNVAERAASLSQYPVFAIPNDLQQMVGHSTEMVRQALDAFVNLDSAAARRVCDRDDVVDRLNAEVIDELIALMKDDPASIEPALHCFSASRHLERVADHATNIAEDVIYLVEGEIVRHAHVELSQAAQPVADANNNGTLE